MALKDWEKSLDETYLVHFYNNKSGKKLRLESIFAETKPNVWRVMADNFVWGELGNIIRDNLKSKADALKFAKSYMRSH